MKGVSDGLYLDCLMSDKANHQCSTKPIVYVEYQAKRFKIGEWSQSARSQACEHVKYKPPSRDLANPEQSIWVQHDVGRGRSAGCGNVEHASEREIAWAVKSVEWI
jgi:hypothetical protein